MENKETKQILETNKIGNLLPILIHHSKEKA